MFSVCVCVLFGMLYTVVNVQSNSQLDCKPSDSEAAWNVSTEFPYVGCFRESCFRRAFNINYPNHMTVGVCTSTCHSENHLVAGLLNGSGCYCGTLVCNFQEKLCDNNCGVPCSGAEDRGKSLSHCGGRAYIQAYNVSFTDSATQDTETGGKPWWQDYRMLAVVIVASCIILSVLCFFVALYEKLKRRRAGGGSRQHKKSSSKKVESHQDKNISYIPPLGDTGKDVTKMTEVADKDYHSYEMCSNKIEALRVEQWAVQRLSGDDGDNGYIEVEASDTTFSTPEIGGDIRHEYFTSNLNLPKSQQNEGKGDGGHKYYTTIVKDINTVRH